MKQGIHPDYHLVVLKTQQPATSLSPVLRLLLAKPLNGKTATNTH